jgi:hypothetical protein
VSAAAAALRRMADAIEAGTVPEPSPHWPLEFRTRDLAALETAAHALGVQDWIRGGGQDEDGGPWAWLSGHVGGVAVRITADERPVLLDPLGEPETAWSLAEGLAAANLAANGTRLDKIRRDLEAVRT